MKFFFFLFFLYTYISQILQECLGELFQARLGGPPSGQEAHLCVLFQDQGDLKGTLSDSHAASLLYRLHKPNRGLLSEDVRTEHFLYLSSFTKATSF